MISQADLPSSTLRAVLRLIALMIAVLLLLPFCAILIVGAGIGGSVARYRMVMSLTPIFCRIMAAALGLHVRIAGTRSSQAKVFVGNHVSYLDILVGGIGVAGVFVSRHDVKEWPVIGIFARLAGTVFIDRRSLRSAISSSAGIVERARQGIRIALFPEGGTTSGESVGEFRPFLFSAISDAEISVQPFTIIYSHIGSVPITAANKTLVYWYDPAPAFTTHGWRLMKMKNIRATIYFHAPSAPPKSGDKSSVRLFADELRGQVLEGLQTGRE